MKNYLLLLLTLISSVCYAAERFRPLEACGTISSTSTAEKPDSFSRRTFSVKVGPAFSVFELTHNLPKEEPDTKAKKENRFAIISSLHDGDKACLDGFAYDIESEDLTSFFAPDQIK